MPIATAGVYTSAVLVTSYENALPANSQLALGTLRLEGTKDAVTPAQAKTLLPLWQAIQNGVLQNDAETNAVLKQIEGTMTAEQLAAIAAMQLTTEDMMAYAQENGLGDGVATRGGGDGHATGRRLFAGRAGWFWQPERGGTGGHARHCRGRWLWRRPGGRREARLWQYDRRAASGHAGHSRGRWGCLRRPARAAAGQGSLTMLAKPLVDLLTQRAAE